MTAASLLLPHVLLTMELLKLVLYTNLAVSIISLLAGTTVAKEPQVLTTFVLDVLLREFSLFVWGLFVQVFRRLRPTGVFVDQAGVSLLNGGGTLVLGTHDSVCLKCPLSRT